MKTVQTRLKPGSTTERWPSITTRLDEHDATPRLLTVGPEVVEIEDDRDANAVLSLYAEKVEEVIG